MAKKVKFIIETKAKVGNPVAKALHNNPAFRSRKEIDKRKKLLGNPPRGDEE